MLVVLRDGRHLHGLLRAYDQFANIVLHDTIERVYSSPSDGADNRKGGVASTAIGTLVIRGENVALLGETVRLLPRSAMPLWLLLWLLLCLPSISVYQVDAQGHDKMAHTRTGPGTRLGGSLFASRVDRLFWNLRR